MERPAPGACATPRATPHQTLHAAYTRTTLALPRSNTSFAGPIPGLLQTACLFHRVPHRAKDFGWLGYEDNPCQHPQDGLIFSTTGYGDNAAPSWRTERTLPGRDTNAMEIVAVVDLRFLYVLADDSGSANDVKDNGGTSGDTGYRPAEAVLEAAALFFSTDKDTMQMENSWEWQGHMPEPEQASAHDLDRALQSLHWVTY